MEGRDSARLAGGKRILSSLLQSLSFMLHKRFPMNVPAKMEAVPLCRICLRDDDDDDDDEGEFQAPAVDIMRIMNRLIENEAEWISFMMTVISLKNVSFGEMSKT